MQSRAGIAYDEKTRETHRFNLHFEQYWGHYDESF